MIGPPITHASRRSGALLIADISGYTRFLQSVADAHQALIIDAPEPPPAYAVMSGPLDAIAHHGTYVAQPIAGHEELLGPDVNIAHRLLKNHAREVIGGVPYALITHAAAQALGLSTDGMLDAEEAYDGGPPFRVHLLVLQSAPDVPADPVENRLPAPFKG
jgi:hypothetical protein